MRHPAVLVTAGFILIVSLQQLGGVDLGIALLILCTACHFLSRTSWLRLLRRLRYMLAVLVLLFAWQTPGRLIAPGWGIMSPSVEGCLLAFDSAGRIVGVISIVALMRHFISREEWVIGLHTLAWPLRFLGVSSERLALRLQLVLQEADSAEQRPWRDWLRTETGSPFKNASFQPRLLRTLDKGLIALLLSLGVASLLW